MLGVGELKGGTGGLPRGETDVPGGGKGCPGGTLALRGSGGPGGGTGEGTADGRGDARKEGSADGGATFVKTELLGVDESETKNKLIQYHMCVHIANHYTIIQFKVFLVELPKQDN